MSRFIPYARKYFEGEEWQQPRKFSEQEAWLDMIFLASFADHTITLSKGESLTLYRGEFYYTQRQLAKRWGWDVAKVNRYFARLAEGTNPRIKKILRETQSETQNETQVETHITVIRLCNYASYNELNLRSETQSETQSETLNNKGDNNTHTHFKLVKDLFVQACWRAHESAEACTEACKACEEMLLFCGQNAEAMTALRNLYRADKTFYAMVEFYRCYPTLQQSFQKPLLPPQMRQLLQRYDISDIWRIIEAIDNKRDTIKGSSLFQTIKQWATTDIVIANRRREESRLN